MISSHISITQYGRARNLATKRGARGVRDLLEAIDPRRWQAHPTAEEIEHADDKEDLVGEALAIAL